MCTNLVPEVGLRQGLHPRENVSAHLLWRERRFFRSGGTVNLNVRLRAVLVHDLERQFLAVRLDGAVLKLTADEALRGVDGAQRGRVRGGCADEPFARGVERDDGGCAAVAVLVGDDLDGI